MNVQLALAVLQIPIFYYVLVATDSLEFFRKLVHSSCGFCRKICCRRLKGSATKATDEQNPMLRKLAVETQQLIASYACATGIVLIGSFYLWSTTVSSRSAFQFGALPFVWRHYHIILLTLEMVLFTTLVALKFNCLSMRAMNLAFACAMLLVSCLALPGMVDSNSMVCVSQFMFMFLFRLTCIPISGSTALVFLALGLNHWCLIWSLDIYLSEVKWYKAGRATEMYMALFSGVWYFDIAAVLACVLLHAWLQRALRSRVSRIMETMSLKTEAVASESLLATFCDAHCFLDSDLCFERDERAIASMLLRTGNNAGIKFLSYIKTPEDELRFLKLTRRGENRTSTAVAQAINLGLKDGYNDQVNVELFHVLTQDRLGRSRHLIGLREYSQEARSGSPCLADDALQGGMRSGEDHSDESESSSQTDSSASASSEGEGKEDKDPEEEEAFILFDCEELEIVGASKRLIQKTGIELADGATFRQFVAQRDEAEFLFFFVSYVTKATEEATAQHFEMRLHMNMGKKRRGKAKWRFTIQYQGQVLLARAVLTSLKPVVKVRHRKHPTCGGFLPIAEPLDAVVEMDRKPLRRTRSSPSQHSSPEVSITLDMVTGGRKPSPPPPSMVTTANSSSSPSPPKRRSSARCHL